MKQTRFCTNNISEYIITNKECSVQIKFKLNEGGE